MRPIRVTKVGEAVTVGMESNVGEGVAEGGATLEGVDTTRTGDNSASSVEPASEVGNDWDNGRLVVGI